MPKILMIHGANMNWLGIRQPEIYGRTTAAELNKMIEDYARQKQFEVENFYSNSEAETIDRIYRAYEEGFDAIVMNPGGFSYTGYALKDALLGVKERLPYVEVHISNHYARGIHSVIAPAAVGVIMGFGIHVYFLGLDAALEIIKKKQS
ncbi:MAG: 3-dehydroquinate dehydratase [Nitrospinota bacterium]|nr:MAG: 3-dehydroquinate dehydratase [Nitrospinota bacterium]